MKEKQNNNIVDIRNRFNDAVLYLKSKKIIKSNQNIVDTGIISKSNMSRATKGDEKYLTYSFLKKFCDKFNVFNETWLLTGEGSMLNEPETIKKVPTNRKTFDPIYDIQTVPIYDSVATLGLVEVFNGSENGNVLDYLSIPNLPKSDGAIFMTGDSMYPILKSGDIVALKIIHKSDIIYGEMHYIEYYSEYGDIEFKTIKYIKKSDLGKDYITLVSQNQHHEPKDILLSKVGTIAIVNASVRYNRL